MLREFVLGQNIAANRLQNIVRLASFCLIQRIALQKDRNGGSYSYRRIVLQKGHNGEQHIIGRHTGKSRYRKIAMAQTLAFTIQKGEFVQLLNVSGCHWITISTLECQQGVVNVYDSIPSCSVPLRNKEQIATIICTQAEEIANPGITVTVWQ